MECCPPYPQPIATRVRTTSGRSVVSPYMWRAFPIWLNIWSAATSAKSGNMISTTGRIPDIAIPRARPVKPASAIGVFSTRPGYFAASPFVAPYAPPPKFATSSPMTTVSLFFSSHLPVTSDIAFEYRTGTKLPKSGRSENFTPAHSAPSLRSPFSTVSSPGHSPARTVRGVPATVQESTARTTPSRARSRTSST